MRGVSKPGVVVFTMASALRAQALQQDARNAKLHTLTEDMQTAVNNGDAGKCVELAADRYIALHTKNPAAPAIPENAFYGKISCGVSPTNAFVSNMVSPYTGSIILYDNDRVDTRREEIVGGLSEDGGPSYQNIEPLEGPMSKPQYRVGYLFVEGEIQDKAAHRMISARARIRDWQKKQSYRAPAQKK